jgi:cytochrome c oxidase accessory protein FixG
MNKPSLDDPGYLGKVIPILASEQSASAASTKTGTSEFLYKAAEKIYPRSVHGLFARLRWLTVLLTQCVFYGLPWLEWGQRQAVLFDLGARRFYLFGVLLYPQDFIYLTGLLIICALSLFLFTAVAGRLWCGYACPQTVYSEIFMWIERRIEGDRSARMRLDQSGLSAEKFFKKSLKHLVWIALAAWTGFTFVGYFTPIHKLAGEILSYQLGPWELFWVCFYAFATYGNAGYMREQVCLYMCPYARFQSAMFDHDTLIVSYDSARGESRGSRSRHDDPKLLGLGACVDCTLCVQVCPTGIDIRDGLQYECIGCGACADVCDTVMDKMGYARGLVRYVTQNALVKGLNRTQMWKRILRPRVLIYTTLLLSLMSFWVVSLSLRVPLKFDIVRDRGSLARITEHGTLENVYRIQIMNATEEDQTYQLSVSGMDGIYIHSSTTLKVRATQSNWVPVQVDIPYEGSSVGSHKIKFELVPLNANYKVTEGSVFIVPR